LRGKQTPPDKGLPTTVLDEGTSKTKPLPEGPQIDNDVFEAGDEMDEDIQQADVEETQSPKPSKESSTKVPTEEPHAEAVASYANLKLSLEDFIHTSFTKYEKTDTALRNFQQILNLFKTDHITSMRRILENIKEVHDAVKETFDFFGLKSLVESLKAVVDAQNDHLATWVKSSTSQSSSAPHAVCQQQHLLLLKEENDDMETEKEETEGDKADKEQGSARASRAIIISTV
ncbi:hypothetical protein Tco_1420207, partial [Tanacetum coccineum]